MSAFIKTFQPDSYEYEQLRIAAELLTAQSPRKFTYKVETVPFDFGQGWYWTTIIGYQDKDGCLPFQALNPRQQEDIILSHDLRATVADVMADRWNPDRLL